MTSVNALIRSTLEGVTDLPVYEEFYCGDKEEYIAYNIRDDRADIYADDDPLEDVVQVTIHLFMKKTSNYLQMKKWIRQALHDADFTWPVITQLEDDGCWHIIFETETVNNYDL